MRVRAVTEVAGESAHPHIVRHVHFLFPSCARTAPWLPDRVKPSADLSSFAPSLSRIASVSVAALAALLVASSSASCASAKLTPAPATEPDVEGTFDGGTSAPDGSTPGDTGATPIEAGPTVQVAVSHDVRILVEPGDNAAALIAAISAAKTSIHMTMYLLTNDKITQALIDQYKAGRDVKVVLNQNFPSGGNTNLSDYNKLVAAKVPVVWAPPAFTFTHSKCVILDNTEAWIMTMNATATSARDNREYLAIDRDAADVAQAESIFQGDYANKQSDASGALLVSPVSSTKRLTELIRSATTSLDMEAESLADDGIVAEIVAAKARGVLIRVVLSTDFTSTGEQAAIATLKASSVPLVSLDTPYVHAKSIVADNARAYVGSINFTATSMRSNREIGLITDAPAEVAKVVTTTAADFRAGTAL